MGHPPLFFIRHSPAAHKGWRYTISRNALSGTGYFAGDTVGGIGPSVDSDTQFGYTSPHISPVDVD